MTVSKKRHYWIVSILTLVILLLSSLLLLILFKIDGFSTWTPNNLPTANPEQPDNTRPFLKEEEVVIIGQESVLDGNVILPIENVLFEYVEVTDGCGPHFEGDCLLVRSGPGNDYKVISRLRNGIILKVGGKVENDGIVWYKIIFDEWLLYPERVKGDWYIASDYVQILYDEGDQTIWENDYATNTNKKIIVDRTEQKLYAYEGDTLFMEIAISTGLELTPTPQGTFTIFKKTPSRYMQGPLPNLSDKQVYDLPGVPWNLYFTHGGAVIHGAYWHNSFGSRYSHGCVNLSPENARKIYNWAELGTKVIVKN